MKQRFTGIMSCLVFASMIVLISCQKDGDVGPKGDTGAPGTPGTPGTPGAPGPAGTANVIYSEWLNVDFNAVKTPDGDTLRFQANIAAPKIVDSILSKGEIKVYFNYGTPVEPDVVPLPYFDPIYFTPAAVLNPDFVLGQIVLTSNYNMGTFDEDNQKRFQYRYILIPGGTAARPSGTNATVNWDDYESVKRYLGLRD
jgi:hypothetical protein